jgi:hypothetical protein
MADLALHARRVATTYPNVHAWEHRHIDIYTHTHAKTCIHTRARAHVDA